MKGEGAEVLVSFGRRSDLCQENLVAVTRDPQRRTRVESKEEGLDIESPEPLAKASAEFVRISENLKV